MNESVWRPLANPASPAELLAPLAELAEAKPSFERDGKGRFLTGNSGGGRPKGARNRLTEVFMSAIVDDFAKHGPKTIERVRDADPVAYLKIVGAMVPSELILQRELEPAIDYAELTYDEAGALAEVERKRRLIKRAIEGI